MTDTGRIILKGNASLCLYLLQLVQRFKAAISNRLVGEWPEALSLAGALASMVAETRDGCHEESPASARYAIRRDLARV